MSAAVEVLKMHCTTLLRKEWWEKKKNMFEFLQWMFSPLGWIEKSFYLSKVTCVKCTQVKVKSLTWMNATVNCLKTRVLKVVNNLNPDLLEKAWPLGLEALMQLVVKTCSTCSYSSKMLLIHWLIWCKRSKYVLHCWLKYTLGKCYSTFLKIAVQHGRLHGKGTRKRRITQLFLFSSVYILIKPYFWMSYHVSGIFCQSIPLNLTHWMRIIVTETTWHLFVKLSQTFSPGNSSGQFIFLYMHTSID